jgi:hypothetical protein
MAELVRVRDDDGGAEIARQLYRRRLPVVHPDEPPRPECHRVAGEVWVRVVEGQLEARYQQQPVSRQCAGPFALDLCAVLVEPVFVDARSSVQGRPRVVRAQHVVGDAENVEAGRRGRPAPAPTPRRRSTSCERGAHRGEPTLAHKAVMIPLRIGVAEAPS